MNGLVTTFCLFLATGPALETFLSNGDSPEVSGRQNEHWAFRVPTRPELPSVQKIDWITNPIDSFVAAEQGRRGLMPNLPADKPTLLRRVTIDLIGLPPTREELHAFLTDESPNAYE